MRISRRKFKPKQVGPVYYVNEQIRVPQLRVITDDGDHLGVVPTHVALQKAREMEQDLVIIQPKAEPPVAKIIDFGKFKYEKDKEVKQQKVRQKSVDIKGVRLSLRIGQHDRDVRRQKAVEFLEEGNRVKIEIILRGRERRHGALAQQVIEQFMNDIRKEVDIKIEQPVTRQNAQLTSIVARA